MPRILALVAGLIVYGSLYPWTFSSSPGPDPLTVLIRTLSVNHWIRRDIFVNVVLYVPLGTSACLTFRRWGWGASALPAAVLLGASLSVCIEFIQLFQPERYSNLLDVVTNTVGSGLGAALGLVLASRPAFRRMPTPRVADPTALMLLVLWAGWLVFPVMPVLGRTVTRVKLRLLLSAPFETLAFCIAAAAWLAAGRLIAAEGARHPGVWLAASTLLIPAQLMIVTRQPDLSTFAGAWAGVILYAATRRMAKPDAAAAAVLICTIVLRALHPFRLSPRPDSFNWIPFASSLESRWDFALAVLLDKFFFYGTAVWLLRSAGMPMWLSAGVMTAIVGVLEAAQIHIVSRTPDITDPVIVVLFALAFRTAYLSRRATH